MTSQQMDPLAQLEGPGDAYEAPNGVESVLPGVADDAGSRDPSATTVAGAVANAMAQQAEMAAGTFGLGSQIGDPINLPPNY